MNFKVTESEIVFSGRVVDVKLDKIEYDSGNKGIRETILHPGGAVVVPFTDDGKFVWINQFRYPHQKFLFEFPAGKLDNKEDPFVCAVRELEEETGYTAEKFEKLGAIATTPGFCTEILHLYLATELKSGYHKREEGEFGMEVHYLTKEESEEKIINGGIIDAKSISAFHLAIAKLKI